MCNGASMFPGRSPHPSGDFFQEEEQQEKITEITNFLTGKASSSYSQNKESKPSSDDFDFEDNFDFFNL